MKMILEKAFCVFALIVFVTMLTNHGNIDFALWDKTVELTKNAVNSEDGQALIAETKETAYDTATLFLGKAKESISSAKNEMDEHSEQTTDDTSTATGTETDTGTVATINEAITNAANTTKSAINKKITTSGFEKAELVRVIDGDTIVVIPDGSVVEEKVRLIGVDTPESVNPDEEKNTEYGEMASTYTKTLLEPIDTIYLDYDEETNDQYGRTLAYVWLMEVDDKSNVNNVANYMLNGILVANGMAIDKMYAPNVAYADIFSELRETAENNKIGLWQIDNVF